MNRAERWLEETLHYRFSDANLFEKALTHRSASSKNYERLEFLGDAVLDFVISEVVYLAHPEAPEGDLSKLRAHLVRDSTLAAVALEIGLGEFLNLGSGELKTGGHRRESILADALEAIFGAVFRDAGFDAARDVVKIALAGRIADLPDVSELRDPKTRLQEWLQARKMSIPTYELLGTTGKDHKRKFEVACSIPEKSLTTTAVGSSRRKAEQKAAREMHAVITGSGQ